MTKRSWIAGTALWLFIFSCTLTVGGAVYESFVITHLWAGSLPESVTGWNTTQQYAIEPVRFWGPNSALHVLAMPKRSPIRCICG